MQHRKIQLQDSAERAELEKQKKQEFMAKLSKNKIGCYAQEKNGYFC